MKVTNKTAYATIGCDVQLSESDRIALGIELDKIINRLEEKAVTFEKAEEAYKALNNLVAFVSKFAIRPSQSNVFTDSPEDFKKADETTTAVEPVKEDNIITVDITKSKAIANLAMIIHRATNISLTKIKKCINTAKDITMLCISFECTQQPKTEVVKKLIASDFTVASNEMPALVLKAEDNKIPV